MQLSFLWSPLFLLVVVWTASLFYYCMHSYISGLTNLKRFSLILSSVGAPPRLFPISSFLILSCFSVTTHQPKLPHFIILILSTCVFPSNTQNHKCGWSYGCCINSHFNLELMLALRCLKHFSLLGGRSRQRKPLCVDSVVRPWIY